MAREPEELGEAEEATFTWPLLGALYSSLVIVVLVALLNSHLGRDLDNEVDAPARTLVAAPVIVCAAVRLPGVHGGSDRAGLPAGSAACGGDRQLADSRLAGDGRDGARGDLLRPPPRQLISVG